MKLFDTHSHYDDNKFDEVGREKLLEELFESDIGYILGASVNIPTSYKQIELSEKFGNFYAAVGIHPENINDCGDIDETLGVIEKLLTFPKVVALGEIGLDYYWEQNPPKEIQQIWFEKQLELSLKLKKPVIIHDREAHGACFDAISKYPGAFGVFHSFSGSAEMAKELVKRGWYISFSGVITFKNASRIAEVVKSIPDDRILVETDCPYLAPVPVRGKTNHSGYVKYTAQKAAELRGIEYDEFVKLTTLNACRLFGIS